MDGRTKCESLRHTITGLQLRKVELDEQEWRLEDEAAITGGIDSEALSRVVEERKSV